MCLIVIALLVSQAVNGAGKRSFHFTPFLGLFEVRGLFFKKEKAVTLIS